VVVNARCEATREHCERSGGGLWFESYAQFEAIVHRLTTDSTLRAVLGRRGQAFVDAHYRWPALIERYGRFADHVLDRRLARAT
jgi:hypothetical protein